MILSADPFEIAGVLLTIEDWLPQLQFAASAQMVRGLVSFDAGHVMIRKPVPVLGIIKARFRVGAPGDGSLELDMDSPRDPLGLIRTFVGKLILKQTAPYARVCRVWKRPNGNLGVSIPGLFITQAWADGNILTIIADLGT